MIPAPKHLLGCTNPAAESAEETQYIGDVHCSCGGTVFQMLHTGATKEYAGELIPCVARINGGYFLLVAARCAHCDREHLLLDNDFHGWNGFVCHDKAQAERPRPPLVAWPCRKCQQTAFAARVTISSEGKEFAIEEADGDLDETNWQEAFGWIDIAIRCQSCGDEQTDWISYETM